MKTLKLDKTWDLTMDDFNNIGIIEGNERLAQDVASSVRVFKYETPFDIERGIEYNKPDEEKFTLQYDMTQEARRIEGVSEAMVVFNSLEDRKLNATIYVTNEQGEQVVVGE